MSEVAEHGGLSIVHAEDDDLANWLTKKYLREGKTHGAYIVETRGPLVEEAAVRRCMLLAERTDSPLYVFHIAAGSAAIALVRACTRGCLFYGETIIAYISFTADKLWDDENRGLLWNNLVIKHQEDQDVLWEAVADDRIQVVDSDHFATSAADRSRRWARRSTRCRPARRSVEIASCVLPPRCPRGPHLAQPLRRARLDEPGEIMGLYPRKGCACRRGDADIVVIDPSKSWTVSAESHHMSPDYNCWEGWSCRAG